MIILPGDKIKVITKDKSIQHYGEKTGTVVRRYGLFKTIVMVIRFILYKNKSNGVYVYQLDNSGNGRIIRQPIYNIFYNKQVLLQSTVEKSRNDGEGITEKIIKI